VFHHPTLYLLHLRYNVIEIKIGQSAGNQEFFKKMNKNDFKMKGLVGTSETTRENIIIPKLSIHRPDHKYPDANQIGYYLAGLIDGAGWISKGGDQPKIVIAFHKKDIHVGYYLKSFFGGGTVKTHLTKQSAVLTFTNRLILIKICTLIHNKLKFLEKINRLNSLIIQLDLGEILTPSIYTSKISIDNHYLAGLIDSDGCLTIRLLNRINRDKVTGAGSVKRFPPLEVRLYLRIELNLKDGEDIINNFKSIFGGHVSPPRKHIDRGGVHTAPNNLSLSHSLSYTSVSFKNMYKILCYLDKYHLNCKYLEYTYLRKAYLLVQDKKHLEEGGLNLIKEYQLKISKLKT